MTPAQIRKDLSYFGRFGKQGRGYNVESLLEQLKSILGLNRGWNLALVGVGRLGRAILGYPGFAPEGFHLVAAFDDDPKVVRQSFGGLIVQPTSQLAEEVAAKSIRIAIVAVPAAQAQAVADQLVSCGIRAILNYAPVAVQTPPEVKARTIDPVVALQSMTYYLTNESRRSASPKETPLRDESAARDARVRRAPERGKGGAP